MADEPAYAPLFGPEPDYSTRNSLYPIMIATVLVCSISTTILATARLIAKRLVSSYNSEDYILILAWAFNIAYAFLLLEDGMAGLGRHLVDVDPTEYTRLFQLSWALEILYTPAIWLAKAALLFQLIRIFTPGGSGPVYWACHSLIWGNLVIYISIFFTILFECHPIKEVWNPFYGGHCINRNMVLVVTSAVNVLSDLLIILLPVWATWHLQMAPKRKAGITAIFAVGLLAFISSICRLVYSIRMLPSTADPAWIVAQIGLWGLAELSTVIICTCFPMMPRLVKLISKRYSQYLSSFSASPLGQALKRSSARDSDANGAEKETPRLERPYERLGGPGWSEASGLREQVRNMGVLKTVSIELVSKDQVEMESTAGSMV